MVTVDQSYAGRTIDLRVGQVIELRLPENPTTGFQWAFTSTGTPACHVVDDSFRRRGTAPGAGGEHRWEISGVQPGTCALSLAYRRSFEHAPPAQVFALQVRVAE